MNVWKSRVFSIDRQYLCVSLGICCFGSLWLASNGSLVAHRFLDASSTLDMHLDEMIKLPPQEHSTHYVFSNEDHNDLGRCFWRPHPSSVLLVNKENQWLWFLGAIARVFPTVLLTRASLPPPSNTKNQPTQCPVAQLPSSTVYIIFHLTRRTTRHNRGLPRTRGNATIQGLRHVLSILTVMQAGTATEMNYNPMCPTQEDAPRRS